MKVYETVLPNTSRISALMQSLHLKRICTNCRHQRVSCSGNTPCNRCKELGIECTDANPDRVSTSHKQSQNATIPSDRPHPTGNQKIVDNQYLIRNHNGSSDPILVPSHIENQNAYNRTVALNQGLQPNQNEQFKTTPDQIVSQNRNFPISSHNPSSYTPRNSQQNPPNSSTPQHLLSKTKARYILKPNTTHSKLYCTIRASQSFSYGIISAAIKITKFNDPFWFGVATDQFQWNTSACGMDQHSWGIDIFGCKVHQGEASRLFNRPLSQGDIIYLSCNITTQKLTFALNDSPPITAYENFLEPNSFLRVAISKVGQKDEIDIIAHAHSKKIETDDKSKRIIN